MNILLVQDICQINFSGIVKEVSKKIDQNKQSKFIHILQKNHDDLDDYIDIMKFRKSKQAAELFDNIDLVIMELNHKNKPWHQKSKKLIQFIKLCLHTKKPIFGTGSIFNTFVFLCATDFDHHINVINGNLLKIGLNGGSIQDINKIQNKFSQFHQHDFFLDQQTGDLFNPVKNDSHYDWKPVQNIGLHYSKVKIQFQNENQNETNNDFKNNKYWKGNLNTDLFLLSKFNHICSVRKQYYQHFLFKGMQTNFVLDIKNYWIMHRFNQINQDNTLQVLSESKNNNSSVIIQVQNQIFSGSFYLDKKFPTSIKIFQNFLEHFSENIELWQNKIKIQDILKTIDIDQRQKKQGNQERDKQQRPQSSKHFNTNIYNNSIANTKRHQGVISIANQAVDFSENDISPNLTLQIENFMKDEDQIISTSRPISAIQRNIQNVSARPISAQNVTARPFSGRSKNQFTNRTIQKTQNITSLKLENVEDQNFEGNFYKLDKVQKSSKYVFLNKERPDNKNKIRRILHPQYTYCCDQREISMNQVEDNKEIVNHLYQITIKHNKKIQKSNISKQNVNTTENHDPSKQNLYSVASQLKNQEYIKKMLIPQSGRDTKSNFQKLQEQMKPVNFFIKVYTQQFKQQYINH